MTKEILNETNTLAKRCRYLLIGYKMTDNFIKERKLNMTEADRIILRTWINKIRSMPYLKHRKQWSDGKRIRILRIIVMRIKGYSFEEISRRFNVTPQRIREIQNRMNYEIGKELEYYQRHRIFNFLNNIKVIK